MNPLADRVRPQKLEEIVGQEHILGEGKLLRKIIESGNIPNMVLYGPPGVGKTTLASLLAKLTNKNYAKLNCTNAGVKEIREVIDEAQKNKDKNGTILYLDELQNLNKRQQQSLLEFIEDGTVTLIASTADNPYFVVYKALLSRSTVFQFNLLDKKDIVKALKRAFELKKEDYSEKQITIDEKSLEYVSEIAGGDLRGAINILENIFNFKCSDEQKEVNITLEDTIECSPVKILNYDRDGDSHYDTLSAFHKSLRGSDPNAAVHYLARLIKGGDLQGICRRLLCVASEDVGLAYPQAITITKACVDSALQLGFPEARIPLSQASIMLATSPKSNSAITAIDSALADLDNMDVGDIPVCIKDGHYAGSKALGHVGYQYPHNFPLSWVEQQYLPNNIKNKEYYNAGNNHSEKSVQDYWNKVLDKWNLSRRRV